MARVSAKIVSHSDFEIVVSIDGKEQRFASLELLRAYFQALAEGGTTVVLGFELMKLCGYDLVVIPVARRIQQVP